MNASQILDDQIIHVKRSRSLGLGFEPAFNSYFDFYLNSKYFDKTLLEFEDVTFHLYLRKNLNDKNPNWRMPTMRYMKERFKVGHNRINAMLDRLEAAHLLKKESGARVGQPNIANIYILSDPIPTLDEFLAVADEGLFAYPLLPKWCAQNEHTGAQNEHTGVPEVSTGLVPETSTHKQTSLHKQTSEEAEVNRGFHRPSIQIDPVFADVRFSVGEKTFDRYMDGAKLLGIEDGVALIGTSRIYAKDFIENRIGEKIKRALSVASVRCVIVED